MLMPWKIQTTDANVQLMSSNVHTFDSDSASNIQGEHRSTDSHFHLTHLQIFSEDFGLRRAKKGKDTEPGDVNDGRKESKQFTEQKQKNMCQSGDGSLDKDVRKKQKRNVVMVRWMWKNTEIWSKG